MLGGSTRFSARWKLTGRNRRFERERGDLSQRMDPGIRTARALRQHPLAP